MSRCKYKPEPEETPQQYLVRIWPVATRDEKILGTIDVLENFTKSEIAKNHRTMSAEYDDLMSAFYLAVVEHVGEYEPERSTPANFFGRFINNLHREEVRRGIPQYYMGKGSKLDKIAKANGYSEGLLDPTLSDIALSRISDESLSTIKQTREIYSNTFCSFEEITNVEDELRLSPEQLVIKEEDDANLVKVFNTLSDFDKWLFIRVAAEKEDGGMSIKKASEYLGKHYQDFGLDAAPTQTALKRRLAIIRRKLKGNQIIKEAYFNLNDDEEDMEEIQRNIADDIASNIDLFD